MTITEERMETLEKQVRRQRRWNIALGVVVVVGGLMAATSSQSVDDIRLYHGSIPDVIRAKEFEVVNDEGTAVFEIIANEDGMGVLNALNKDGKVFAKVGAAANGGGLILFNKDGIIVAGIGAKADGMGLLNVRNKDGKLVAGIIADEDGMGVLKVHDKDGKTVAVISADANGDGVIKTFNNEGKVTSTTP